MTDVMLYRVSDKPNAELGGRNLIYRVTSADAVEAALADGWRHCPDDAEFGESKTLLDGTAEEIKAALPGLSDDDLLTALDAETAGKTRKGVIAAIEAEVASRQSEA